MNGTYHPDNIYAESTNVKRTLLSAKYTMAGLFQIQNYYPDSSVSALAIHTIPNYMNRFFHMHQICPSYDQAYDELLKSEEFTSILRSNQSLIDYLTLHSGQNISTISDIKRLQQTLWIEELKGFP